MSDVVSWHSYVDATILEIGDNDGWASFMKLLSNARDCPLWFMIGARRIGKTDLALQIAIILWSQLKYKKRKKNQKKKEDQESTREEKAEEPSSENSEI